MIDHRIETFLTLCSTLNYTKAAKELCITQPAVTQHIKYLENYYDCQLFEYEGKQLKLTIKGAMLYEYALAMSSNAKKIHEQLANVERTHIRLGATKSIADYILPKVIVEYMKTNSSKLIDVVTDNTEGLLKRLNEGRIDVALVEGSFNQMDYEVELLQEEPYLCVASKDLLLTPNHISDLWETSLIVREKGSGTRNILEYYLKQQCLELDCFKTRIVVNNFNIIKLMLLQGIGISFLYQMVIKEELKNGDLVEVKLPGLPMKRPLHFVYTKDSLFQEEYKEFIQKFQNIFMKKESA